MEDDVRFDQLAHFLLEVLAQVLDRVDAACGDRDVRVDGIAELGVVRAVCVSLVVADGSRVEGDVVCGNPVVDEEALHDDVLFGDGVEEVLHVVSDKTVVEVPEYLVCGDFHFGESSCVDHAAAVACLFDAAIDECAERDDGDGKDQCFWDASLHLFSPYVFVRKIIYLRVKE